MIRDTCVLCEKSKPLEEVFRLKNYPITPSSNELDASTDEFADFVLATCNTCGCIQLKTLVDPIKLYENSHNSTENTPTWKEHHRLFADFISQRADKKLLEVGGNSGTLYKLLSSKISNYTILDICDSPKRPSTLTFIQGNCEDFDLTGHTHIALSHTFEHLYQPKRFVENLSKAQVQSVFISIPNMDHLYISKNLSIIHNEHTFYVGDAEIRHLFSRYKYSCSATYSFKNHSLFYHFVYDPTTEPLALINSMQRSMNITEYFSAFERSVKDVVIEHPCFICPAGHYGQKIYYYLRDYHRNMIGFIDNDPSKQGKRVYGTSANVYSPEILKTYNDKPICVILYAGPYNSEIKTQLNTLHDSIVYISI
jgi:hypothetical protein